MNAIVIQGLSKHFRKQTIRSSHTTLKSEVVRWLRRQPKKVEAPDSRIRALERIDLVIPRGKTFGIIGRNGSGKSTLLKLITGIYTPTQGTVEVQGRISALLELGAGFHPEFSGRENILINGIILGMSRAEIRAKMDEIIAFSELGDFIDEPVRTYSSGMFMRLAFAVATNVDPDVLIVDEILAVGDARFSKKSKAKMDEFKRAGKTIVLVTHDLSTVVRWCDEAAWIEAGTIRSQGEPARVVAEYQALMNAEDRQAQGGAKAQALPPLPLELEGVRVGEQPVAGPVCLDSEDPLALQVGYRLEQLLPVELELTVRRADGLEVYAGPVPLAAPLARQGKLQLAVSRIGLVTGQYTLGLTARAEGYSPAGADRLLELEVRSTAKERGVARWPQRWLQLPLAEAEAEAERFRISAKVG